MKIPPWLILSCLYASFSIRATSADCLNGGIIFDRLTSCSYEALLSAYTIKFNDPIYKCDDASTTAEADLWVKLGGATSLSQAQAYVTANICAKAFASRQYIPFAQAANKGTDYEFEKRYFDGKSEWNERVETLFGPKGRGVSSYNLQDDTRTIQTFQNGLARTEQVEFPTRLSNFANCATNTVYCCFVTDRQANDGNGNCATPYDLNCADKDPGDNTDLCFVDHKRNPKSNSNSTGETTFSRDDDNNSDRAEGPIHCHGFAWANDDNDRTSRYKGNNLHFVSMFDHFNQRGYVRNVPGAPMCACAEQMPVVSRADCTEVNPTEYYKIFYNGQGWGATLTSIELTFAACNGYNGNNNNLYAYMQRLYFVDKKVNSSQLALLSQYIVGNNNCDYAVAALMQSKGYVGGYQETSSLSGMTQIAGRGLFLMDGNTADQSKGNMGDSSFMQLYNSSPTGILLRICQDCEASHEKIYVRFNPGYSPNAVNSSAPFFQWLKANVPQDQSLIGSYGVVWAIYSTYEDALARKNAWSCPSYNWQQVFPGDCDPTQGTKANQYSRFEPYYDGRVNVAWYIDAANPFVPTNQRTFGGSANFSSVTFLMDNPVRGGFDMLPNGTAFVRGSGWDIWGQKDYANFISRGISGLNTTISMQLRSFVGFPSGYSWAKGCLMIRKSTSPNSASYELCLTSGNDFVTQWRKTDNAEREGNSIVWDGTSKVNSGWMKVTKNGDYYSSFVSYDGVNWQQRGYTQYLPGLVNGKYFVGIAISSQSDRLAEAVVDQFLIYPPVSLAADVSATASPAAQISSKPLTTKPITAKPITTKPATTKPVSAKPITAKPITTKPATTKPVSAKPTTAKPITTKPATAKPVSAKPITLKPVTAKPITLQPLTYGPVAPIPNPAVQVSQAPVPKPAPKPAAIIPQPATKPAPAIPKPVTKPAPKPAPTIPKPAIKPAPTIPKPALKPAPTIPKPQPNKPK